MRKVRPFEQFLILVDRAQTGSEVHQHTSKRADDWSNDGRYIPTNLDRARQKEAPSSG